MSDGFVANFVRFATVQIFENQLIFDKITESLNQSIERHFQSLHDWTVRFLSTHTTNKTLTNHDEDPSPTPVNHEKTQTLQPTAAVTAQNFCAMRYEYNAASL